MVLLDVLQVVLTPQVQVVLVAVYEASIRPDAVALVDEVVLAVTKEIGRWLRDPDTKAVLKEGLRDQVRLLSEQSGMIEGASPALAIQRRHGCREGISPELRRACALALEAPASARIQSAWMYSVGVWCALALLLGVCLWRRSREAAVTVWLGTVILWVGGLALPMLTVEARIGELEVLLAGDRLRFVDNVLFYESKSILQFVWTLLAGGSWDTILVGVLVAAFSVVFPLAKLAAAAWLHVRRAAATPPRWVQVLVTQTSQWSMADVFVVALFMSYLGFGRMIQDQIDGIGRGSDSVRAIATDGTSLQLGFFYFLAFVLASVATKPLYKRLVHGGSDGHEAAASVEPDAG